MFGMSYQQPIISSIRLENLEASAQQAADDAAQVKIDVQGLHDLTLQYRNDAQFYFEQVQQFQEGDYVTTLTFNDALAAFSFSDLASVPSEYNPSAHRHSWTELDDVPLTFAPSAHRHDWSDLDNVPVEFEPAEHVHTWQQISGKPATFPPEIHVHDWSEIQNKPSAFMPVAHQHSWADITGKPSTYTPSAHTHEWTEIQNKPDLVKVGDFGLGTEGDAGNLVMDANVNNLNTSGMFYLGGNPDNVPSEAVSGGHLIVNSNRASGNSQVSQILIDWNTDAAWFRRRQSGDWQGWVEFWHSSNLLIARNESGSGVGISSTVSGSSLSPAQSGTWRNAARPLANGETGLWMKV